MKASAVVQPVVWIAAACAVGRVLAGATQEPFGLLAPTTAIIIRDASAAADVVSCIRASFKQSVETRGCTMLGSVIERVLGLRARRMEDVAQTETSDHRGGGEEFFTKATAS